MSQCQHIMAAGRRCGSPAVKTHKFCYHHRRMHDAYCLPGDAAYEPEPLDSHQAITLTLHHLELALDKRRITVREYRARLFAVQLALANIKRAAAEPAPPADEMLTQYTPAMRDLHHLNRNQPCETANALCEKCAAELPVGEDTKPEPVEEPIELDPLAPPCPIEWLQPPDLPEPSDSGRLWYPPTTEELLSYKLPPHDKLGTLQQENQRRRQKLSFALHQIDNPTVFQIKNQIEKIEEEERRQNLGLAAKRDLLFCGYLEKLGLKIDVPEENSAPAQLTPSEVV